MKFLNKTHKNIREVLSSNWFLYAVIILFSLQALWIVFSFRYPMVFDEQFHLSVIRIHSDKLTPFLGNQPTEWDQFGPLQSGSHGIYHYLMSIPYRFIDLLTNTERTFVVLLRILNVGMVAAGLLLYAKLFRLIKIRQQYISVAILLFTLLPIVPFVAAHINYDNMLFPLTALFLIFAVRIIQAKKVEWLDLVAFATIGIMTPLIKFTFFPILVLTGMFVITSLFRRHGKKLTHEFIKSFKQTTRQRQYVSIAVLTIAIGMFVALPVRNVLTHGSITPKCASVLGADRCDGVWTSIREQEALATKDQRQVDISSFNSSWFQHMTLLGNTGANTYNGGRETTFPPQTIKLLTTLGPILGIGGLLYAWTGLQKTKGWYLLIFVAAGLLLSVYYINLTDYLRLHAQFANQARYNLSVIPIFIAMSVAAYAHIFRRHSWAKYGILVFVLLLFTQGGGVITHIVRSEDTWYWQDHRVIRLNHAAKKILKPIVAE